jgi:hypothetical protein
MKNSTKKMGFRKIKRIFAPFGAVIYMVMSSWGTIWFGGKCRIDPGKMEGSESSPDNKNTLVASLPSAYFGVVYCIIVASKRLKKIIEYLYLGSPLSIPTQVQFFSIQSKHNCNCSFYGRVLSNGDFFWNFQIFNWNFSPFFI